MPDGTYLNDYFIPRLHKNNVSILKDDIKENIKNYRRRLLALAVATPQKYEEQEWLDFVLQEVEETCDCLEEDSVRLAHVYYLLENPEKCQDELCKEDWSDDKNHKR